VAFCAVQRLRADAQTREADGFAAVAAPSVVPGLHPGECGLHISQNDPRSRGKAVLHLDQCGAESRRTSGRRRLADPPQLLTAKRTLFEQARPQHRKVTSGNSGVDN